MHFEIPSKGGIFKIEGVAEKAFRALERGSKLNRDLSDHCNHWDYVHRPIEEVRDEIGLH